jgi:NAD(P)H dehydrogenase (quinone)
MLNLLKGNSPKPLDMILITGATGHLGKKTIDFLLKNVSVKSVSALVRNLAKGEELKAQGIELRTGDYSDYNSLVQAFKGVDTLLLVSSGTLENRIEQHIHAIDAAKENQVKHIVYTSAIGANDKMKFIPGVDHYHTEEYLKASGIPYTILRNTFYAEVLPMLLGDALTSGDWYYAAGEGKANFASRTDMAEALANVLAHPSGHKNKTYEITSGKSYSFHELADVLRTISGKLVRYLPTPLEALKEGMKKTRNECTSSERVAWKQPSNPHSKTRRHQRPHIQKLNGMHTLWCICTEIISMLRNRGGLNSNRNSRA